MALLDWIWLGAAWAVGIGGVVLFVWALAWDRSRGRRRCPKCWYDMGGVGTKEAGELPATCPECGRVARRERKLRKTRRHWRWAVAAVLLVVVGIGGGFGRSVYRNGWVRATPTIAYIVALPWLNDTSLTAEITRRATDGLPHWEHVLLVRRLVGVLDTAESRARLDRALRLSQVIEMRATQSAGIRDPLRWSLAGIAPNRCQRALMRLAVYENADVRMNTVLLAGLLARRGRTEPIIVALRAMGDGDERVRAAARGALALQWNEEVGVPCPICALSDDSSASTRALATGPLNEVPKRGLSSDDPCIVATTIWILNAAKLTDAAWLDMAFEHVGVRNAEIRRQLAWLMIRTGWREEGLELARSHLGAGELAVRDLAALVKRFPDRLLPLREAIRSILDTSDYTSDAVLADYARIYVMLGGAADGAAAVLLERLDRNVAVENAARRSGMSGHFRSSNILDALGNIGELKPRVSKAYWEGASWSQESKLAALAALEERMANGGVEDRSHAAAASMQIGSDPARAIEVALRAALEEGAESAGLAQVGAMVIRGDLPKDFVSELLKDSDPDRRLVGTLLADAMGPSAAPLLEVLREMEEDPSPRVAERAMWTVESVERQIRQSE